MEEDPSVCCDESRDQETGQPEATCCAGTMKCPRFEWEWKIDNIGWSLRRSCEFHGWCLSRWIPLHRWRASPILSGLYLAKGSGTHSTEIMYATSCLRPLGWIVSIDEPHSSLLFYRSPPCSYSSWLRPHYLTPHRRRQGLQLWLYISCCNCPGNWIWVEKLAIAPSGDSWSRLSKALSWV